MSEIAAAVDEAEIKTLLRERRGEWTSIAERAEVSHSWLSKFVNDRIPNPGVQTLRKVRAAIEAAPHGEPEPKAA